MSTKKRRMNCKFCDSFFYKIDDLVSHTEKDHSDMITPGMDAWQYIYFLRTGRINGNCIMCKKPTTWNKKTHKYNRFCSDPKCKEKYKKIFKERMIGKYGKTSLLNDPDHQRYMLSKRKISGTYLWRDRVHQSGYTGTYELSFLEFLDKVMMLDPEDVMSPSPHTYFYMYEGKKHFYIPDFFISSLNLEVEIKEGTNNHPKIQAVDKIKEQKKDEVMATTRAFNYIKIVEKHNERFLDFLEEAKRRFIENDESPIVMI